MVQIEDHPLWSGPSPSLMESMSQFLLQIGEVLGSLEKVVVNVKPVAKFESCLEVVKLGVKGFGKVERLLIEMGLQSMDVQLVAIHCPRISSENMAKIWKSSNVQVVVKDPETLTFTKRFYDGSPMDVSVLLEPMEVTVLREPNQIPWEKANVDFILECSTLVNNDKDAQSSDQSEATNKTEDSDNCLRCLPKVLDAFGLYANGTMRAYFHNDHSKTRAAKFNIVTSSSAAAKAVCHAEIFPDWNENPTNMSFIATAALAALHRLADIHMPNVDLQVTLEKTEYCNGIHTRFSDADGKVHCRLKAIMSMCLDIIRCLPVGACCVELA